MSELAPLHRHSRRTRKVFASLTAMAAALGFASALQVAAPAYACACGAFAQPPAADAPITLNSESAIVSLADGQEQIDMRLALNSMTSETGLIVPTPSPATVALGSMSDFSALATEMKPVDVYHWWSFGEYWPGETGAANPGSAPIVLDQVQLGPLQATTLAASDSTGLTSWLADNGYGLPDQETSRLGHYTDRGWSFVALKLTGAQSLDGDLAPIRLTFASDKLVYPLFLSQAATTDQEVNLYILADHRQRVTFAGGGTAPTQYVTWARAVHDPTLQQRGTYLTTITLPFWNPSTEITDDLQIQQAPYDYDVVVYNDIYLGLGWILVGIGVIVLIIIWRYVRTRRRT